MKISLNQGVDIRPPRTEHDKVKISELSQEILNLSINKLLVNLRFMDSAMSRLELHQYKGPVAVDGTKFMYNPIQLLMAYRENPDAPTHAYLHGVLHCVFRHFYVDKDINKFYWSLACDIAVEAMILEMELDCTQIGGEKIQRRLINQLRGKIKVLTAEKIYRYLVDGNSPPEQMELLKDAFVIDSHKVWYGKNKDGDQEPLDDPQTSTLAGEHDEYEEFLKDELEEESQPYNKNSDKKKTKGQWEEVAEKIQLDLESFSKEKGNKQETLMQNLKSVNREKYDYTDFLKKFAVMREHIQVNDDEFDYIFYTYGLNMYGKMPLIEPLEYKETKKIKDFVIAIDTSGSVSGELVQKFVEKTYNILEQQENFFTKINLHIIQCDQEIQEDVKIENKEQFDAYLKQMEIKGMGGTDFRPVFQYVDQLIEKKEISNLKGLIYFTDGEGIYPSHQPKYDAAFVFVDDEYNEPDVPVWAIRIVLQSDEI